MQSIQSMNQTNNTKSHSITNLSSGCAIGCGVTLPTSTVDPEMEAVSSPKSRCRDPEVLKGRTLPIRFMFDCFVAVD